jgi:hypothetical protein
MRVTEPSPALILACVALLFALGGSAIAASRYVIDSAAQIKPSVVQALTRASGRYLEVITPEVTFTPGKPPAGQETAFCPRAGQLQNGPLTSRSAYHVVTGGYVADLAPGTIVDADRPVAATGWTVNVTDPSGSGGTSHFRVFALCQPGSASAAGPGYWSVQ